MMNKDHKKAQYQIRDFLQSKGWDSCLEQRIRLLNGKEHVDDFVAYVDVDVFAIKNQEVFICEVGQTNSKARIDALREMFNTVSQIRLGRKPYRNSAFKKNYWDKITHASVKIDTRSVFSDKEWQILRERNVSAKC